MLCVDGREPWSFREPIHRVWLDTGKIQAYEFLRVSASTFPCCDGSHHWEPDPACSIAGATSSSSAAWLRVWRTCPVPLVARLLGSQIRIPIIFMKLWTIYWHQPAGKSVHLFVAKIGPNQPPAVPKWPASCSICVDIQLPCHWYGANIDYNIHMYTFIMYMYIHSCLSFERSTPKHSSPPSSGHRWCPDSPGCRPSSPGPLKPSAVSPPSAALPVAWPRDGLPAAASRSPGSSGEDAWRIPRNPMESHGRWGVWRVWSQKPGWDSTPGL